MDLEIEELHRIACLNKEQFFILPKTQNVKVFTSFAHLQRGSCCKNGCMFCPFGNSPKAKSYSISSGL